MTAVPLQTTVYDITDCKIFPLATDVPGGASPTYGAIVDVPGISALSMDPDIVAQDLKGDGGKIIASKARIDKFTIKATYGKLAFDVLNTVLGGLITALGPGADGSLGQDWDLLYGAQLPLFGLAVEIPDCDVEAGVGDVLGWFYKARVVGSTLLSQQTDSFGQPTMDITVYNPLSSIGRAQKFRLAAAPSPITRMI